jgi:hypothetical protein
LHHGRRQKPHQFIVQAGSGSLRNLAEHSLQHQLQQLADQIARSHQHQDQKQGMLQQQIPEWE